MQLAEVIKIANYAGLWVLLPVTVRSKVALRDFADLLTRPLHARIAELEAQLRALGDVPRETS